MRLPNNVRIETQRKGSHTERPACYLYFGRTHGHDVALHGWEVPTGCTWCEPIGAYVTLEDYQVRQMLELVFAPIFPSR